MPRIHGVNASPFVRKTRIVLVEKGIDYELIPVMPVGVSAEFKKISPLGKIPCYEDGEFALPDSSVICAYLERIHPEPALYPEEPKAYGRALWYEELADTRLVDVLSTVFFQRVVQAKFMKQEPDEEAVRHAIGELIPPVFDYLEGELGARDREFIVGDRFSIADISLVSPFVNFQHAGESVDSARWPSLAAYVERLQARPSIHSLIEEERASFSSL